MSGEPPKRVLIGAVSSLLTALTFVLAWISTTAWGRIDSQDIVISNDGQRLSGAEGRLEQIDRRLGRVETKLDDLPETLLRLLEERDRRAR
jgi:hypothetical protein